MTTPKKVIGILDERKFKILMEIVESFIKTEEPVGSKTLSEKSSIGVSPATIRNDMRVLEELGFIRKPHLSAGRIPSDKGYRMYVNLSLDQDLSPSEEFREIFIKNLENTEESITDILDFSSGIFSKLTNYTTVIIAPIYQFKVIKHLGLSIFEDGKIVAVYIDIDDNTQTRVIYYDNISNKKDLKNYNDFISQRLLHKPKEELNMIYENLKEDFPHFDLSKRILKLGIDFLNKDKSYDIYQSGLANLLDFDQDHDFESVRSILELMEDESKLIDIVKAPMSEDNIDVTIGQENKNEVLKSASIIRASYEIFDGDYGSIGIIGPTRMDYKYLMETILGLSNTLTSLNKMIKR